MKIRKIAAAVGSALLSVLLTALLAILLDAAAAFLNYKMAPAAFAAACVILLVGIHFIRLFTVKRKIQICVVLVSLAALTGLVSAGIWNTFQKTAGYQDVDSGKARLYADQSVMVIVPHQDDENNILGGVIEAFLDYGSTVRIVYMTNGDRYGIPETRLKEALAYCAHVGIPEENVIFLGYGDGWASDAPHIYNASGDASMTSFYGADRTFGLDTHPAYSEGRAYTLENYLSDLESVILEYRPDVIFCSDYDKHIEHMSTTLLFEKVMGGILQKEPGYRPLVFKGYAYNTAWYAPADYYAVNILSTQEAATEPMVYRWQDAVRFPVDAGTLSRAMLNSGAYHSLGFFASQHAQEKAASIINGDRVFWQRRTDSLCAQARITVSSGSGELLNNFMLIDNFDLREQEHPFDSVWIPEEADRERSAAVEFPEAADVYSIVLYDHPSEYENVRNAVIAFEDGTKIETGALHPLGAATEIPVGKKNVKRFTVTLTDTEGSAGLTEIEAFTQSTQGELAFVKFMDPEGNFAYDYCVTEGTTAEFTLYTHGLGQDVITGAYQITSSNEKLLASVSGDTVYVECPVGEAGTITVQWEDGTVSDSIYLQNPGFWKTLHIKLGQMAEEFAAVKYRQMLLYKLWRAFPELMNRYF